MELFNVIFEEIIYDVVHKSVATIFEHVFLIELKIISDTSEPLRISWQSIYKSPRILYTFFFFENFSISHYCKAFSVDNQDKKRFGIENRGNIGIQYI